ncbi:MAG: hypothetical protein ACC726_08065 [Chloroflexota bacterium]
MPRWRIETWIFISWNVGMAALLASNLSGDRCAGIPYGSSLTACAMGAAFEMLFAVLAIALLWPIGAVVIGSFWLRGRSDPSRGARQADRPPRPRISRTHEGPDTDAVLTAAALNVAEWQTVGLSLVEAAWIAKPKRMIGGPFRLGVAFGKPGFRFARLWPYEENVVEAVLARLPGSSSQHGGR